MWPHLSLRQGGEVAWSLSVGLGVLDVHPVGEQHQGQRPPRVSAKATSPGPSPTADWEVHAGGT